jgi:CheY-like chemotaxis protein
MKKKPKILAVDDEVFNLDILESILEDADYQVVRAEDGNIALQKLRETGAIDVIILDRMMPKMDGIMVLKTLKSDPQYRDIPVIMQTADAQNSQMLEGIRAGAYYYLIKPYSEDVLLGIVRAAIRDAKAHELLRREMRNQKSVIPLLSLARFHFRTLEEAANIARYVANFCPRPEEAAYGLSELMNNAVEHGNLRVSPERKLEFTAQNHWREEVERLAALPENAQKFATLTYEAKGSDITITVADQGKGFNWKNYLDFDPTRMTEPVGRGIAMCKAVYFPDMEFKLGGTQAVCHLSRDT